MERLNSGTMVHTYFIVFQQQQDWDSQSILVNWGVCYLASLSIAVLRLVSHDYRVGFFDGKPVLQRSISWMLTSVLISGQFFMNSQMLSAFFTFFLLVRDAKVALQMQILNPVFADIIFYFLVSEIKSLLSV
jgi:hypothetical protein